MSNASLHEPAPVFSPFADDAAVASLGGLTFENGTARIAVHGSLALGQDRRGLERARRMRSLLDAIVSALEAEDLANNLPDAIEDEAQAATPVANPFA